MYDEGLEQKDTERPGAQLPKFFVGKTQLALLIEGFQDVANVIQEIKKKVVVLFCHKKKCCTVKKV